MTKKKKKKEKEAKKTDSAHFYFLLRSLSFRSFNSRLYFHKTCHTSLQSALFRALFLGLTSNKRFPLYAMHVSHYTVCTYISLEVFQKYLSIKSFQQVLQSPYNAKSTKEKENVIGKLEETFTTRCYLSTFFLYIG